MSVWILFPLKKNQKKLAYKKTNNGTIKFLRKKMRPLTFSQKVRKEFFMMVKSFHKIFFLEKPA